MKIKELARNMFVRNCEHVTRLELLGRKLSEKTLDQKRKFLDIIVGQFGDDELESISSSRIVRYLFSEEEEKSSSWKNHYLDTFKSLYEEYVWRTDEEIVVPKFPRFSDDSKKADVFSTEELGIFFNHELWEDYTEFLFFYVTVNCGLRLGEARGLMARQFDFEHHILIVDGFIRFDGSRTSFNKAGSLRDKKTRIVFIPSDVEKKLKAYFKENNFAAGDFVFTKQGSPVSAVYCDRLFKRMLKKAEIDVGNRKLTPHSLRYTYVTRMRRYVSGDVARILVGHASLEMTDYYTKPLIEDMMKQIEESREAAEKLFL